MTPKQQAFINEYARSQNGTQSAIKAGYSPKVATVIASKNLSKRSIQEAILRKRAKIEERKFISRELILDILMHEGTDMQNPARVRIYALKTAFHCLVIHERLEKEEARSCNFKHLGHVKGGGVEVRARKGGPYRDQLFQTSS